jgi:hypothetical protein
MLQSDYCVAGVLEQWPHHRAEARDQYRGRGRYCDGGTGARQHDGRSAVQNAECNARPIRFLANPAQPGEHCFLGRGANQGKSFASKVGRDNRLLTTEWVSLRKDDAPAFPPYSSMTNPSAFRGSEASTRSTVFASSAGSTSGSDNSTSSTKTFGEPAWNAARMEVSASVAASSVRPILNRPERPCAASCAPRMASSTCSRMWRASARNSLPADVSPARRWRCRKQADAQLLFQPGYLFGDRRLRDLKSIGRATKIQLLGDDNK